MFEEFWSIRLPRYENTLHEKFHSTPLKIPKVQLFLMQSVPASVANINLLLVHYYALTFMLYFFKRVCTPTQVSLVNLAQVEDEWTYDGNYVMSPLSTY